MQYVTALPNFTDINIKNIPAQLDALLKNNLAAIDALLKNNTHYTWENLLQPIENLNDALHRFWSPIQHVSAVMNSPELRETIHHCLPKLSDYHTTISQNEILFHALESIQQGKDFKKLTVAQRKSIENDIRDFQLSGVHLLPEKKAQFAFLAKSLSQLAQQFEDNVLDATMAWKKHITDEALLTGVPQHAKNAARKNAEKENKPGWIFTLEAPDYLAIMLHADSALLREECYRAFVTRASDMGPNAGKFDNSKIMQDIITKRFELAKLLGFRNFAEYSLATKMVKTTEEVFSFLNELCEKSFAKAQKEFQTLAQFAKTNYGAASLNAWDIAYYSEKLRQSAYAISPEDLRPYFPEPFVLKGLFEIMHRLYNIRLEKIKHPNVWHPDAQCFQICDTNHHPQAFLFLDLYARANKRGGAWMDDAVMRRKLDDGRIQLPAAYVTCNFNAPVGDDPALFTHDDVVTLFHECGHALQHVLTQINVANVSGIHGIPWDAVEVASQFFENWACEKESIGYITSHFQTHLPLPKDLFERMEKVKNFQSAMQMMRQLEFALFDFQLHTQFDEHDPHCIQKTLNAVRQKTAVFRAPDFNRFQHSFTHVFGGSYAAGYYSYKWAEVMACDAFSLFQEKGIFDHATSEKFKKTFLESGGSREPMDLFIEFRGRKPSVDALLKQTGIV